MQGTYLQLLKDHNIEIWETRRSNKEVISCNRL
jgi:hypothetical protein